MDIVARVNKIVRSQKKEYIKEVNRLVPNNNLPKNLYTKSFADMMSIIMDSGPARPHDNLRIHMTTSIDTIGKAVCTVNGTRMGRAGDFSGPGKLSNAKLLKSYGSTRGIIGLPISDTEFFQACERIFEPALKVVHYPFHISIGTPLKLEEHAKEGYNIIPSGQEINGGRPIGLRIPDYAHAQPLCELFFVTEDKEALAMEDVIYLRPSDGFCISGGIAGTVHHNGCNYFSRQFYHINNIGHFEGFSFKAVKELPLDILSFAAARLINVR